MTFDEMLEQVRELLQSKGRVAYRALKRRFELDDEYLEDLKAELIKAERVAVDENGEVLVWTGDGINGETDKREKGKTEVISSQLSVVSPQPLAPNPQPIAAERRQLTVMFCDLVGSTALSAQLDPEELREVVRAYQETCSIVIRRYDGHIAQHLGDGLLVYFGYPLAHEDDAARAVRAGLEIVAALQRQVPDPWRKDTAGKILPGPPLSKEGTEMPPFVKGAAHSAGGFGSVEVGRELQVRIGIHTGLVVIGEIGSSEKRELLALGETPNLAARIQGQANPNEVLISAATYHLVEGLFECEDHGQPELKGVSTPPTLYQVRTESTAHSRFDTAIQKGLTPLVGREEELALLRRRWEQAKEGEGQVVLLSGEAGIGKSRLVQELKDVVSREGAVRIEFRCSSYHQNSAFYPILDHLQRLLQFAPDDSPTVKLEKLQAARVGAQHAAPLPSDTIPLLAALLSLPHPEGYPPITVSPQKQKEKTQETLVAWIVEETERQAVYLVWEDLHWIDPSSLDVLTLLLQQVATSRALVVLTYRPDFILPWRSRTHSTQLTLSRLGRQHVAAMVKLVLSQASRPSILRQAQDSGRTESDSNGESVSVRAEPVEVRTALATEVVQQIVSRTDGVPLFVEEITKTVVESVSQGVWESSGALAQSALQFSIPTTLQDALMARLDRLGTAKIIAQLGASIGREFSYELLQAASPIDAATLQKALQQLVDAELLYQRGLPPQATYLFKHALVQETAYQSLLKSKRQQYHQQIAQVFEAQFPENTETQPELVAHHYTEAGLVEQAIPYWQKAGERASQRSAYVEAVGHLTKGLELLKTFPETQERAQQELSLQITLGNTLMTTKGFGAPEVGKVYRRARELCQQVGETPQLFPALWGLWLFHAGRGELQTAQELGEQLFGLAQIEQDSALLLEAHHALWATSFWRGELALARAHSKQGIALYDPLQHRSLAFLYGGHDPGGCCRNFGALTLWLLGYPDQALQSSHEALALTRKLSHPFSLAEALGYASWLHEFRREEQAVQEWVEAVIVLSTEQGFPYWLVRGLILRGWALVEQGQGEEGIAQMRQGLAAMRVTGVELFRSHFLALLAEGYGKVRQTEEGLTVLAEALAQVNKTGERCYEAELYRLKGELLLAQEIKSQKSKGKSQNTENTDPRPLAPDPQGEAEACFLKAIDISRKQQAKSLELRATVSLARLWQQQSKHAEAHQVLSDIYNWFTEGVDTKGLQEAKALLEELSHEGKG